MMCSTTGNKTKRLKDLVIMMFDVCGKFVWIWFHHRAEGYGTEKEHKYTPRTVIDVQH